MRNIIIYYYELFNNDNLIKCETISKINLLIIEWIYISKLNILFNSIWYYKHN